jgi:3D (Asp-Asp-Asp) domain-containing protein
MSSMQVIEKQVDIKNEVHINNGMIKERIEIQFEKDKIEFEKRKAEEQKQIELKRIEDEKIKKEQQLKEENNREWKTFVLTFYTNLVQENSSMGGVTCTGRRLQDGMVASNYYDLNTKIHLDGWGEVTVSDRGGSNFNNDTRLDCYIPKNDGENNAHYFNRVNNMGRKIIRGYIVK